MTVVEPEVVRPGVRGQLIRFVGFGVLAAGVDFGTYSLFLWLGLGPDLAKACSFVLGTTTAYLLNKRWTFNAKGGSGQAVKFAVLYTVTFFVNVGVNKLGVHLLAGHSWQKPVAWVIAQGAATIINFVLLRTVVFRN